MTEGAKGTSKILRALRTGLETGNVAHTNLRQDLGQFEYKGTYVVGGVLADFWQVSLRDDYLEKLGIGCYTLMVDVPLKSSRLVRRGSWEMNTEESVSESQLNRMDTNVQHRD